MSEKRLFQEYKQLRKTPASENNHQILELAPKDPESSINEWYAVIAKPTKTDSPYYYNGKWTLQIAADAEYPRQPPKISFCRKTKINHPNIKFDTGEICLDILKSEAWSPAWNLAHLVGAVLMLLDEPEPDSPLNVDSANLYRSDKVAFESAVQYTMWRENTLYDREKNGSGRKETEEDDDDDSDEDDSSSLKKQENGTVKKDSKGTDEGNNEHSTKAGNDAGNDSGSTPLHKSLDSLSIGPESEPENVSARRLLSNISVDCAKRPAETASSPENNKYPKDSRESVNMNPPTFQFNYSVSSSHKPSAGLLSKGPYGKHSKTDSETDLEYIHSIGRHITEEFLKKATEVQIASPRGNCANSSDTSSRQLAAVHQHVSNNVAKQIEEICSRTNSCSQSPTHETYREMADVKSAEESFREKIEQQVDEIRRLQERQSLA